MPPKRDYPSFMNPNGYIADSHLPTKVQVDRWHDAGLKYPPPQPDESQYFYQQRLARELKAAMKNNPDMFKSRLAPKQPKSTSKTQPLTRPSSKPPLKSAGFEIPHKEAARRPGFKTNTLRTGGSAMLALLAQNQMARNRAR